MKSNTVKCTYCGDGISVIRVKAHEKMCAKWTDEQRAERTRLRAYNRNGGHRPVTRSRNNSNQAGYQNQNGKRIRLVISLDFDSFREVVMQLAPSFNLDKIEVS